MSRLGDIADMAEYLTERITARDPADPPTTRERIRDFERSPVGIAQQYYRPGSFDAQQPEAGDVNPFLLRYALDAFRDSPVQGPLRAPVAAVSGTAAPVGEFLDPRSPLAAGGYASQLPMPWPLKAAALALGGVLESDKAEGSGLLKGLRKAAQGWTGKIGDLADVGHLPQGTYANWFLRYGPEGEVNLINKSGPTGHKFATLKGTARPEELIAQAGGAQPPVHRGPPVDMAKLQREGAEIVFGPTDATAGGAWLSMPGGTIRQEAGANFPQMHRGVRVPGMPEDVRPLYASVDTGKATDTNRKAFEILERGGVPYYATVLQSPGGADSAKQMAATVLAQLREAEPGRKAIGLVDEAVRAKGKGAAGYPGYDNPLLSDWLDTAGLDARRAFVEGVDTRKVLDATGVDVGLARYLNTDPRFYHTPSGSVGATIGKMRPDVGVTDYPLHSNYRATFMGQKGEIGELPGGIPFSWIAPDMHRGLLRYVNPKSGTAANTPAVQVTRGIAADVPQVQKVTQEVVDNYGKWFEKNPRGWAIPGAIGLGAIADQSRYR